MTSACNISKTEVLRNLNGRSLLCKIKLRKINLSFSYWVTSDATTTTTVLRPYSRDHPGEPVPEENFWTLWCKRRFTEADIPTIRLGATPSGLTSAHLHHPPMMLMLLLLPFKYTAKQYMPNEYWLADRKPAQSSVRNNNSALTLKMHVHVQAMVSACAMVEYTLRVLHTHRMCDTALQTVFQATVMAKLLYAACATDLPSNRHHRSNGDCLEGKRENYQVCSVQYCVQ